MHKHLVMWSSMALFGAMLFSCSPDNPLPVTVRPSVGELSRRQSASINIGPGERLIGSAMLLPEGRMVTNLHVVQHRTDSVRITIDGSSFFAVRLLATDEKSDLALFQLPEGMDFESPLPASADPRPGMPVFAYGAAFGLHRSYLQGYVSHSDRRLQENGGERSYVQTQGITYPGMSGAPVYALDGKWIGINRAAYGYSLGTGIGLVIPASTVRRFLDKEAP
ncbi:MAG: trypsin-like peptidase domain-containing protein [Leptospiraceae bacterium]|nr:trypsin-like peptidase domain-containing protein [Leptospiraceae bacterium]